MWFRLSVPCVYFNEHVFLVVKEFLKMFGIFLYHDIVKLASSYSLVLMKVILAAKNVTCTLFLNVGCYAVENGRSIKDVCKIYSSSPTLICFFAFDSTRLPLCVWMSFLDIFNAIWPIDGITDTTNRQYLSCDACLKVKREDNQNCSVLCCVRQLCTMICTICTQMWAVLTVLWIGFCHTGPISLCVDLFVCILFLFHTAHVFYYCNHGGVDLMGLKPNP